jgi:Transposase and inactivated derivatives
MLDAKADAMCNAQRYEHSPDRVDTRAGSYSRKMHTQVGEVELKIPKLRKQTFESAIIERYRRREISVEEAIVQMYLAGVSVRRVEDVTEALWGTRVSSGTVSNLNQKVFKHIVKACSSRSLNLDRASICSWSKPIGTRQDARSNEL